MNDREEIKKIIADACSYKRDMTLSMSLRDMGMDSLDMISMVLDLETTFEIIISDDNWTLDTTVETVISEVSEAIKSIRTEKCS